MADTLSTTPKLLITNIAKKVETTPKIFIANNSKSVETKPVLFIATVPFSVTITINGDSKRNVYVDETILADTEREVTDGISTVTLQTDTKRTVFTECTINADTSRTVKTFSYLYFNTKRTVSNVDKKQPSITDKYHNVFTLSPLVESDFSQGVILSGTYQIPTEHRIFNETNVTTYIITGLEVEAFNVAQWIDSVDNFDEIVNFENKNITKCVNASAYIRTSNDGITFGNWQKLFDGAQYQGKYYDFRLELSTTYKYITPVVKLFGYIVHR